LTQPTGAIENQMEGQAGRGRCRICWWGTCRDHATAIGGSTNVVSEGMLLWENLKKFCLKWSKKERENPSDTT